MKMEVHRLKKIHDIHEDHTKANSEKEELIREQMFLNGEHDFISFLLNQKAELPELLVFAYQSIQHYSHLFIDIVQSSRFIEWIQWLDHYPEGAVKEQLVAPALTMMKLSWRLNIEHRPISKENLNAMIDFALHCVSSKNLSIAEQASRLVEAVMAKDPDSHYFSLLNQHAQRALQNVQEGAIFRYLSIGTAISELNEDIANEVVVKGSFAAIAFSLCQSPDVLLAINALDILTKFAKTRVGLDEMCRETILDWLITVSCGREDIAKAPDQFLSSEGLRVLGEVFRQAARHSSQFVTKINHQCVESFLSAVYHFLDDGQEVQKITGLDLVSDFAMISTQSLLMMQSFRSGALLKLWLGLLSSAKVELQAAALTGFVRIFDQPDEQYVRNGILDNTTETSAPVSVFTLSDVNMETEIGRVAEFKKTVFKMIGEEKRVSTVHYLVKAARQPVGSIRNAAMDLMRSIASQPAGGWGLRSLFNNGYDPVHCEFWEYLKDRTTEFSKEGKDFKFALIQVVQKSPFHDHLGEDIVNHLNIMVSQGAYYMPPRLEEMETL